MYVAAQIDNNCDPASENRAYVHNKFDHYLDFEIP